jgi:DNA (cytosine-5)-methyltransferase 1
MKHSRAAAAAHQIRLPLGSAGSTPWGEASGTFSPMLRMQSGGSATWSALDLFSGAGGMSYGFHAHPKFALLGAVDAQIGKPSTGVGTLGCNSTYELNIGFAPTEADLAAVQPAELRQSLGIGRGELTVLLACPPCTGFSRTLAHNHLVDDPRNSLVVRTGQFVEEFEPAVLLMENARELLIGRFGHHFARLRAWLDGRYEFYAGTHFLDEFGLAQQRERALVVAVRSPLRPRSLKELWSGFSIDPKATHVRRAIWGLPPVGPGQAHPDDRMHVSPRLKELGRRRMRAIPKDGGSWADLIARPDADELLTPAMKRIAAARDWKSHPDVYGRMWWDRPAPTIKRECAHVGNGRYAHPEQDRLCTVREMALLQGFPSDYRFAGGNLANMYRHIGDAVPPLISYQLACLADWILSDRRPPIESVILPGTSLTEFDVERS